MNQLNQLEADKQYLYQDGCEWPVFIRYVIIRDGQFQLIQTKEEFQAVFAPINSEDEALSYALATTDLQALYDFDLGFDFRYFTNRIEATHVDKTEDGYLVYLFHYEGCGCGPHTMSAVTVHVKTDGTLEQQSQQPLYEDPKLDNYCVD